MGAVSEQGFSLLGLLLTLAVTPQLLRHLSHEEYGINAIVTQLFAYVAIMDFGVSAAINRQLALHQPGTPHFAEFTNKVTSTGFFFLLPVAALIVLLGAGMSWVAPAIFRVPPVLERTVILYFLSIVLLIAATFPLRAIRGVFFAHQRQSLSVWISGLPGLVNLPLVWVGVANGLGIWAFLCANVVTAVLETILTFAFLRWHYPEVIVSPRQFDRAVLKDLLHFGSRVLVVSICGLVVYNTNRILAGSLVAVGAVTAYSLTLRLPEMAFRMVNILAKNVGPALFAIGADRARFVQDYRRLYILNSYLVSGVLVLTGCLNGPFVKLWLGPEFFAGSGVVIVHSVFLAIFSIGTYNGHYFSISGKIGVVTRAAMVEAALNFGVSLVLALRFGVLGISLGSLLAALSVIAYPYRALARDLGIERQFFARFLVAPLCVAMAVIVLFGTLNVQIGTWWQLGGAALALALGIGVAMVFLLPAEIQQALVSKLGPWAPQWLHLARK